MSKEYLATWLEYVDRYSWEAEEAVMEEEHERALVFSNLAVAWSNLLTAVDPAFLSKHVARTRPDGPNPNLPSAVERRQIAENAARDRREALELVIAERRRQEDEARRAREVDTPNPMGVN